MEDTVKDEYPTKTDGSKFSGRIKFSISTKIITGIVLLLLSTIGLLNFSVIVLIQNDKKAYIYQSQGNEISLVGKDFSARVLRSISTLRLALASVNPQKQLTASESLTFKSIIANQTEMQRAWLQTLNLQTGLAHIAETAGDIDIQKNNLGKPLVPNSLSEMKTSPPPSPLAKEANLFLNIREMKKEFYKKLLPELIEESFLILNLSKPGEQPAIGILLADTKLKNNPQGIPVVVGILNISDLMNQIATLHLTIGTKNGRLLLDSDPTIHFSEYSDSLILKDPLFLKAFASRSESGAQEYDFNGEHFLGSFQNIGQGLFVVSRTSWKKAMAATYSLTEKFILLGLMAVSLAIIITIFFTKNITIPVNRLFHATKSVAQGNFEVNLNVTSRDEIGALTQSFNAMSLQISRLILERMKKVQMENELKIAATVQQTLIPPAACSGKGFKIQSYYQSANECGGDWWGYFESPGKVTLMIADATGHGLPSALVTAAAHSCASMIGKLVAEHPELVFNPARILSFANQVIHDATKGSIMMTWFVVTADLKNRTLTFANAGHTIPWVFKKTADPNTPFEMKSLAISGHRLGESLEFNHFEEQTFFLNENDIIFVYTDGLLEAKNLSGQQFGKKRVRTILSETVKEGPEKMLEETLNQFRAHNEGKPLDDDLTMVALQITGLESDEVTPKT